MSELEVVDGAKDESVEVRKDLDDVDGAAAAKEAREIKSLGLIQKFDDESVELIVASNELRQVARAINYAGVSAPKKKHDQHTYIAVSTSCICFKTTRAGTSCSLTFSLNTEMGAEHSSDAVAFELEPHVLPAMHTIANGKRPLYLIYDRKSGTLRVSTKDQDKSDLFVVSFATDKVAREAVFNKELKDAKQLGNKPPEALRRGLEFARLLCRRDEDTKSHRGVTIKDGIASGGYRHGASWCVHQAFTGLNGDIGYDESADFCRLLSRLSTEAECWLEDGRIILHDGPIACTCDIEKPSFRGDFVGKVAADVSVAVDRKLVFYQASMFNALATRQTKERLGVHGTVAGEANDAKLELRFKPGVGRQDHLRAWFGTPAVRRAGATSSLIEWTFSANIADLARVLEFLDVGEIEIGKSSNRFVIVGDANPGAERFVAALLDPKLDLSKIPAPNK